MKVDDLVVGKLYILYPFSDNLILSVFETPEEALGYRYRGGIGGLVGPWMLLEVQPVTTSYPTKRRDGVLPVMCHVLTDSSIGYVALFGEENLPWKP